MSILEEVQSWYSSQCDGVWENDYRVEIGTLNNPGWSLKIDLASTHLSGAPFNEIRNEVSDDEWFHCRVENDQFVGYGGPQNLEDLLVIFLNWAKADIGWLQPPTYVNETIEDKNRRFWESLPKDVKGENCKVEGCKHDRIQYSALCRQHHFEKYNLSDLSGE